MNNTIVVSTMFNCSNLDIFSNIGNPRVRHNMIGCYIVEVLQIMYNFSVIFEIESTTGASNRSIDLYANPKSMSRRILDVAKPVQAVMLCRYGFILRRPKDYNIYQRYYSKPFNRTVWICFYAILMITILVFYTLSWYEHRMLSTNWECSFCNEAFIALGGYLQHIVPMDSIANSRRTAYFTFFLFCYVIYTFYTSNLLSHLVSDKHNVAQLSYITENNFNVAILEGFERNYTFDIYDNNIYLLSEKLRNSKVVPLTVALEDVRTKRTALLSDYISVYPLLRKTFTNEEICEITKIDISSEIRKYLFASKQFRFREEVVIGTLRAKEAGIIQRISHYEEYRPLYCYSVAHPEVGFSQILIPLLLMLMLFTLATLILLAEIWFFNRTAVLPYIE